MHKKIIEETDKYLKQFVEEGLDQGDNLKYVGDLIDIQKDAYEIECMKEDENMYGEYGEYNERRGGRRGSYGRDEYGRGRYGEYGNYGEYGRSVDSRYRGYGHLDRMYDDYGRYEANRERYGANEDTKKSLKYMLESMEDFARMLKEEASSQEEVEMIRQTAQRIAQM